ncbi:MAG: crossover junction endodeoxyribonuclease RuvC [Clostridia bacterium]|nr:crossover junction endodeoxyribonuclease RuvC [Clostridia bacterium]
MVILGIDPGIATVGFGVVETKNAASRYVNCGVISTPAGERTEKRLWDIFRETGELIERYRPEALAIEELFFTNNQKTAVNVCQARGVILAAAEKFSVPVTEYTPLQVKVAVSGYGKAPKSQIMEMTKIILHLCDVPRPDDAADALALAITHAAIGGSKLGALKNSYLQTSKKTAGS